MPDLQVSSPITEQGFRHFDKSVARNSMRRHGWLSKATGNDGSGGDITLTDQLNRRMQQMAMRFPKPIEFEGYLIGDRSDALTHFILPRYLVGVDLQRKEKIKLEQVTNITSETSAMLAIREDNGGFGLQVIASQEGAPQDGSQFFSFDQLVLDQPLSYFLSDQMLRDLFPGLERVQITNEMLIKAVKDDTQRIFHTYFEGKVPDFTVQMLPVSLNIDMFGARRSLHPTNKFQLNVLRKNRFDQGRTYGLSHIHYGYTPQEIDRDPIFAALSKDDEKFVRLISPEDADQLVSSVSTINILSRGEFDNTGIGIVGVTALDPQNFRIIGSSFFDLKKLSQNEDDYYKFGDLATLANNSTDVGVIKEFFQLVGAYSPPYLPEKVVSIKEDSASSPSAS